MKTIKIPIRDWELYYVPCAAARKGKTAFLRKYPNRDLRYGAEARWTQQQGNPIPVYHMDAVRGFVENLKGERLWTGPEQQHFGDAKEDALQYIRDTPDCYLSLSYRLKQHVWRSPIGYRDNRTFMHRSTTDQDVIDWLVKLKELTDKL